MMSDPLLLNLTSWKNVVKVLSLNVVKASQPICTGSHWSGLVNLVLHWTMSRVSGSVMPYVFLHHRQSILAKGKFSTMKRSMGFPRCSTAAITLQELSYHFWSRLLLWAACMNLLSTQSQCKVAPYDGASTD